MNYDLETVYDEQIAPLMTQIIAICREHKLPFVASFAYRRDENGEHDLCTTAIDWERRAPAKFDLVTRLLYQPGTEL